VFLSLSQFHDKPTTNSFTVQSHLAVINVTTQRFEHQVGYVSFRIDWFVCIEAIEMLYFVNAKNGNRCLHFDFAAAFQPFTQGLNIDEGESDNPKMDQHTVKKMHLLLSDQKIFPPLGFDVLWIFVIIFRFIVEELAKIKL
jgi:hypothetical protein